MILTGIIYGSLSGQMAEISTGVIESGKEAVDLCITMMGVVALWTGLMEIAKRSGLMDGFTKILRPFLRFLFPDIPEDHPALTYISVNTLANILGLGWAATPAGLKAMEQMAKLEREGKRESKKEGKKEIETRREIETERASNEMCTFLVLNISSLQLIPINMIAYRSQYGSVNPASIIAPAILATTVSTLTGVLFAKWMCRKRRGRT